MRLLPIFRVGPQPSFGWQVYVFSNFYYPFAQRDAQCFTEMIPSTLLVKYRIKHSYWLIPLQTQ